MRVRVFRVFNVRLRVPRAWDYFTFAGRTYHVGDGPMTMSTTERIEVFRD